MLFKYIGIWSWLVLFTVDAFVVKYDWLKAHLYFCRCEALSLEKKGLPRAALQASLAVHNKYCDTLPHQEDVFTLLFIVHNSAYASTSTLGIWLNGCRHSP